MRIELWPCRIRYVGIDSNNIADLMHSSIMGYGCVARHMTILFVQET